MLYGDYNHKRSTVLLKLTALKIILKKCNKCAHTIGVSAIRDNKIINLRAKKKLLFVQQLCLHHFCYIQILDQHTISNKLVYLLFLII